MIAGECWISSVIHWEHFYNEISAANTMYGCLAFFYYESKTCVENSEVVACG